jgi:hypothetical protein
MKINIKLTFFSLTFVSLLISQISFVHAETLPSVSTISSVNTVEYSSVLTGSVTMVGTGSIVRRGFQVKPMSSSVFTDSVCEEGTFSTGSFTLSTNGSCAGVPIPLLACNTTYNYRAIAYNSIGSSTGATQSFKTALCPTVPYLSKFVLLILSLTVLD